MQWLWVYIATGGGLAVGLLRHFTKYPDNLPGFFKEVTTFHVEPKWAIHTIVLSAISIATGANIGPEQALVCR
jgi:H+/Cl- antiporter ClcA